MFEMIDRQSAAQRQKAEMERAKLKKSGRVNFAGLADTEAPRLRLGEVLEKKPDTGFSLYKQKITEDGKPFWLSQGDDHLAHIQSIPGMQENGGTPICHPTVCHISDLTVLAESAPAAPLLHHNTTTISPAAP